MICVVVALVAGIGLVPLIAADGGGSTAAAGSQPAPVRVVVGTANLDRLGTALVDGSGRALYMFAPDQHSRVACNAACQKIWPPLVAPRSGVAKAVGEARQSLIGSAPNPVDGERIVTYAGWPLYTYVLDRARQIASGQNVVLNGGYWWVLEPDGQVNRKAVPHTTAIAGS